MASEEMYLNPPPIRSTLPPFNSTTTYSDRSPQYQRSAQTEPEEPSRNKFQKIDSPRHNIQSQSPRRIPAEEYYQNEEKQVASPPPFPVENTTFWVPRSPPTGPSHPQYQNFRQPHRLDMYPSYEYDHRAQYRPSYQPPYPPNSGQRIIPPSYSQPPMPTYESQARWSDHVPPPPRPPPPPPPHRTQSATDQLVPMRAPPPAVASGMQRSYAQSRPVRGSSGSRRSPYPPSTDGRGRVSSSSSAGSRSYGGSGGGGRRRFEKRDGYGPRTSRH
ncbi:hypothetical protein VTL71DRAFT_5209 [Oculimacula yallundae]|uniref:Uncharacterized protein n=1 Tax=Oculimacula yallundae TaxID=86028 RepID=A0ABR4C0G5_9HELO